MTTPDLHAAIMNLPYDTSNQPFACVGAFREGHKQARHAAAELVSRQARWVPVAEEPPLQDVDVLCSRSMGRPPIVAALFKGEFFAFDRPDEALDGIEGWRELN